MRKFEKRRYQERTVEAFSQWFNSSEPLASIILPTGCGKSYTTALCINQIPNHKILWVAHREELCEQGIDAIKSVSPSENVSLELAKNKASAQDRIIVGSVQTLFREREHLKDFTPDLIFIDEYHHFSDGNIQYANLLKRWPKAKVLGATATPFRFGGQNLPLGQVLIQMDIGTAVEKGYLVPPKAEPLLTSVSLADVKSRMGDFAIKELSEAVNVEARNKLIANRVIEYIRNGRQGILFAVDVNHSKAMADILRKEVRVGEVYGDTPTEERRELMKKIRNGDIDILCNNLVCLDDQTEILTTSGWVGMNDITLEHKVANWSNGKIWFSTPKNIVKRNRKPGEKMVSLETRKRSIRVTEDHELLFKTNPTGNFKKSKAIYLVNRAIELPVSGQSIPNSITLPSIKKTTSNLSRRIAANSYTLRQKNPQLSLEDSRAIAKKRIEEHDSLSYKAPHQLSEAECNLIGFWLGDGTKTTLSSGGLEYKITQAGSNINITKWFDGILKFLDIDYQRKTKLRTTNKNPIPHEVTSWSFSRGTGFGSQKRHGIFHLEPYLDKKGSDLLWGLNQNQFDALIEGFWKSDGDHLDGNKRKKGLVLYQKDKTILEKLQAIAVCRGYVASLRKYDNHGSYLHHLFLRKEKCHKLTKHRLVIENDWKDEQVWCVKTDSGNIITRRKGSVTVMGNCTEGFDVPHLSFVAMGRPTRSLGLYTQAVGRGLRTCPQNGKTDCIVLDVHDKIKIKQSRITFSDMATAGDLYGEKKRTKNVLKAPVPVEEISHHLKNFPIFIAKEKLDRWQTDEDFFPITSWSIAPDQWIITWAAEITQPKLITKTKPAPLTQITPEVGLVVTHEKFGKGKIRKINRSNILVEFAWSDLRIIDSSFLTTQIAYQEESLEEIEIKKIEKLFYLCIPDFNQGRVLFFHRNGWNLKLITDQQFTKQEAESLVMEEASKDGVLSLLRTNAKWKLGPASDKQKEYVTNMARSGKIGYDLDIDGLTKGEASSIIEQAKWQPLIVKKFGTDYKNKLLGYDIESEDV